MDEARWLLKALRETAGELQSQFLALDDDATRWRPNDDEWCLIELFGHLRDTENLYLRRILSMLRQRNPALPNIDVEMWPAERGYARTPLRTFVREFAAARGETLGLLWSRIEGDWERGGVHEYRGRITVLDVARDINQHDLQHLWQARRLVRAYEAARGLPAGTLLE